jgi:hypothetical protein
MLITLSNHILFNVATPENTEIIGGWAGDQLDKLGQSITDGIYQGFVAVMNSVADFIFWGSKAGVLFCIISYIAAKDRRSVSLGVKLLLIYVIAAVVIGKL